MSFTLIKTSQPLFKPHSQTQSTGTDHHTHVRVTRVDGKDKRYLSRRRDALMVERLLILRNDSLDKKDTRLMTTESVQVDDEVENQLAPPDRQRLKVAQLSTDVSFDNSASFDQEDPPTDSLLSEKVKRRKSRRPTEPLVRSLFSFFVASESPSSAQW